MFTMRLDEELSLIVMDSREQDISEGGLRRRVQMDLGLLQDH
jgi:hypothetical protein